MVSRPGFRRIVAVDARNTARLTMNNPRNGYQSCVDVYAHPADVADAVILFARNQCIRPTEVEMSTIWPDGDRPRQPPRRTFCEAATVTTAPAALTPQSWPRNVPTGTRR
jgi:hypothetical protein